MKKYSLFRIILKFSICAVVFALSHTLEADENLTSSAVQIHESSIPWDAIGQVNVAGYRKISQCTGTLIAKDQVLTAGHCLIDPQTHQELSIASIHFLSGVRGGQHKGHAKAKCVKFLKNLGTRKQTGNKKISLEDFSDDAAIIILSETLEVEASSLADNLDIVPGQRLLHIAYPLSRRFFPTIHTECHLLQTEATPNLWLTNCPSSPGSSGGPLFVSSKDSFKLAAVMVGADKYSYAVPLSAWSNLVDEHSCP